MVYHKKMCHFSGFSSLDQKKRPRGLYIWKSAFAAFYGRPTFGPLCFVDGFLLSQKPIPLALLLPRQIPIKQLFEKWGQYICFGVPGLAGDYSSNRGGLPIIAIHRVKAALWDLESNFWLGGSLRSKPAFFVSRVSQSNALNDSGHTKIGSA